MGTVFGDHDGEGGVGTPFRGRCNPSVFTGVRSRGERANMNDHS
jgi:hypothetical protein